MGTYTVVYKDYAADTFDAAAAAMLRDREVWRVEGGADGQPFYGAASGSNIGYAVERWEWVQAEHRLRVWFR